MYKDYYIISNGDIKRKENTIYYYNLEGEKKILPVEQVDDIHIYGEVDLNTKLINYIFTIIVGATISVSIRVMGILVISSIIVIPAATAMQFKKGFTKSLIISMIIGVIDVLSGLLLASLFDLAPGGTIALTSVIVLILSLILNRKKL